MAWSFHPQQWVAQSWPSKNGEMRSKSRRKASMIDDKSVARCPRRPHSPRTNGQHWPLWLSIRRRPGTVGHQPFWWPLVPKGLEVEHVPGGRCQVPTKQRKIYSLQTRFHLVDPDKAAAGTESQPSAKPAVPSALTSRHRNRTFTCRRCAPLPLTINSQVGAVTSLIIAH